MDKYDGAIQYLRENSGRLLNAYLNPLDHTGGCLFQMVTPSGDYEDDRVGCLVQVRGGKKVALTKDLTERIAADERLPKCFKEISQDNLHVLAEWQRDLDREIRGK